MGVWGLLSFVQMHNPPLGQAVSLSEAANSRDGEPRVIVVDGNALAYHLFQRCQECCWWDGGELRDFEASVRQWVRDVQGSGVMLRCVLDGMLDPMKQDTAVQRGRDNALKVEATLSKLGACRGNYGALGAEGFVLPLGCLDILASTLVSEGVPTRRAMYEADSELARECAEHGALGVLSNDSDFICMRVPLLPLNELRVCHGQVTAVVYQPEACASSLALPKECLPMLACMCGNDFVPKELLDTLHTSLAPGSKPNRAWHVIRGSAKLIREACTPGEDIGRDAMMRLLRGMLVEGDDDGLAQLSCAVKECLARYSMHSAPRPEGASAGGGGGGAGSPGGGAGKGGGVPEEEEWLEQQLSSLRLSPNCLQHGRHGWAWLRPAVEFHASGQHALGAFERSRLVRRAGYAQSAPEGAHTVSEWAPWGAGYRKAQMEVGARRRGVGRGEGEARRREALLEVCEGVLAQHGGGEGGAEVEALRRLPPGEVLLGLSLRLLVTSRPRPSYEKRTIASLAAAACVPQEVFTAWRAERGGAMWGGRRDIAIINASAALLAMIMAVNDINDVMARPFPAQSLAVLSPRLAHELASATGGVLAGMAGIEGERTEWRERVARLMDAACVGTPGDAFVETKRAKKRRQQQDAVSEAGGKQGSKQGGRVGAGAGNAFSLLMGQDSFD